MRTLRPIATRAVGLALLFWATAAAGQPQCPPPPADPTGPAVQQAIQNARNRGALWRFEKDGRSGYLYTTVHVGKLEWAAPGRMVSRALNESDTIAVEADLTDPAFNAAMGASQKPEEAPVLPPPLIARMRARADKVCAPWQQLERMPAMMRIMTLTVLDSGWDGLHVDYATELVLAGFAKSAGKPLVSLETAAIQRGALLGGTPAEQLAIIESAVQGLEDGSARKEVLSTVNAWATGDLDALQSSLATLSPVERTALERIVFARNPGLADRIEELHRGGKRIFATAGIMHMIGDRGLPKLLAARGFKIERVAFDDR